MNYVKQEELINVLNIDKNIHIIGCGALGSWLGLFLLKMGFRNINIYDYDVIEEHNIPNQFFKENQIGMNKVDAFFDLAKEICSDAEERVKVFNKKITLVNSKNLDGIVFNCVDSMSARKIIYNNGYKDNKNVDLFIEDRMGLYGGFIFTLFKKDKNEFEKYEATLYEDEETEVSVCGISQTAIPSAVNIASMLIMQMIGWINGKEIDSKIMYQIPDLLCVKERW